MLKLSEVQGNLNWNGCLGSTGPNAITPSVLTPGLNYDFQPDHSEAPCESLCPP